MSQFSDDSMFNIVFFANFFGEIIQFLGQQTVILICDNNLDRKLTVIIRLFTVIIFRVRFWIEMEDK